MDIFISQYITDKVKVDIFFLEIFFRQYIVDKVNRIVNC